MNPNNRIAGKSTREMADRRRRNGIIVGLIVIAIAIVLCFFAINSKSLGLGGGAFLALLIAIRLLGDWFEGFNRRSKKLEKRAIRGARAEETVGFILDTLGSEYYVLNDIANPYGNIDHIVIGEFTGVFLIETKSHHGKVGVFDGGILINGRQPEKDFIKQILNNTYWLKERISQIVGTQPWITPVLVFTNAFVPYSQPVKNIYVINKRYLVGTVTKIRKIDATNIRVWGQKEKINENLLNNSSIHFSNRQMPY
jgi:hypothetical protein